MDTVYVGPGAVESLTVPTGVNIAGSRAEFREIKHGGGVLKGADLVSDNCACRSPVLTWRRSWRKEIPP